MRLTEGSLPSVSYGRGTFAQKDQKDEPLLINDLILGYWGTCYCLRRIQCRVAKSSGQEPEHGRRRTRQSAMRRRAERARKSVIVCGRRWASFG